MVQEYNAQLVEQFSTDFPRRKDVALDLGLMDSLYHNMVGIRSFWNFSRRSELGTVLDMVRGMAMTDTGATTCAPYTHAVAAYFQAATLFYRTSETALNITGLETYINANYRGMTLGMWIQPRSIAAGTRYFTAKHNFLNNLQLYIRQNGSTLESAISNTGAAWITSNHGTALQNSVWQFVCLRFRPGAFVDILLDKVWASAATAVASIFAGTAPMTLGGFRTTAGANSAYFNGYMVNPFYVAAALPNYHIEMIRQWTRPLLG